MTHLHSSLRRCVARRANRVIVAGVALMCLGLAACVNTPPVLAQLMEARRTGSELRVAFLKANEASNRAVLASTDEDSKAAAQEANEATATAEKSLGALTPLLQSLGYQAEATTLQAFRTHFDEFRKLDEEILPLAVENTNIKAQQLSFGAAAEAADAVVAALNAARSGAGGRSDAEAQAEGIRADIREVQMLQARHIAEVDADAMTRLETQTAALLQDARTRLARLRPLVSGSAGQQVAVAGAALDRFAGVDTEIVALSRRNTNVRSLALTLGRKRVVAAECEADLKALEQALARHGTEATR